MNLYSHPPIREKGLHFVFGLCVEALNCPSIRPSETQINSLIWKIQKKPESGRRAHVQLAILTTNTLATIDKLPATSIATFCKGI